METGGYISFAVCSYYKDETFSEFMYNILDSVISLQWDSLNVRVLFKALGV